MRQKQIETLLANSNRLLPSLEQIERQIQALDDDSNFDKELRHLARLLYSLNEQAFCQFLSDNKNTLQKPFDKYFDNENLQ